MFFPYRDDNPRVLIPYVTYTLVAANIFIFLYQFIVSIEQGPLAGFAITLNYGLIPAMLTSIPIEQIIAYNIDHIIGNMKISPDLVFQPNSPLLTVFTSMFLHGGFMHLIGNMWFLWLFGDNVEGTMGHKRFAIFYILSGLGAAATQIAFDVSSMIPMIGASGAVSGVLAAYMFRFPRARIHVFFFIFIFFTTIHVPAFVVIGFWFFEQLTNGLGAIGLDTSGGVAWFAHIGGFITGLALERFYRHSH